MHAINLVRQLDAGMVKKIPDNAPTVLLRKSYAAHIRIRTAI